MSKDICIYVLKCPDTNQVRYVGKTDNTKRRYRIHISNVSGDDTRRKRWINSLKKNGKLPIFEVVEITNKADWPKREIFWISFYRKLVGDKLTNTAKGGLGGGAKHTCAAKNKISKARKGMKFSKSHKNNLKKAKEALYSCDRGKDVIKKLSKINATLTDEQVKEIYLLSHQSGISQKSIGDMYNISQSCVHDIKHNKSYKHIERPEFLI